MFKKILRFCKLWWYVLFDREYLFLYLLEEKANKCLEDCVTLKVTNTEQLEDLIFHIKSYYEIPKVVKELKFPNLKIPDVKKILKSDVDLVPKEVADYLIEVEMQRAIERDFIFEHAKNLPFGFTM